MGNEESRGSDQKSQTLETGIGRGTEDRRSSSLGITLAAGLIGAGLGYLGYNLFSGDEKEGEKNEDKKARPQKVKTMKGDEVPDSFICPISGEIMKDPVITPSGVSYDRANIEAWLKKKEIDPLTKKPLTVNDLVPNRGLKEAIEQFMNKCN